MLHFEISKTDLQKVMYEKSHNPNYKIRNRSMVLWIKHLGKPHKEIAEICSLSPNQITKLLGQFMTQGSEAFFSLKYRKPESSLKPFADQLISEFIERPVFGAAQARKIIRQLTGIHLSIRAILYFLQNLGLKPRKTSFIPSKADPEIQNTFFKKKLRPLLQQARKGKVEVFFCDAAHFVWGAYPGVIWSFCRIFIPSPSGRSRFNVLGAFNPLSMHFHTYTNIGQINADSVIELMKGLAKSVGDKRIVLVLDNARYNRSRKVQEASIDYGIQLEFLPPYSPNLNLIERVWKLMKKKTLNGIYYATFPEFKNAILDCIKKLNMKSGYRAELQSLATLNFQSFTESHKWAA